MNYKSTVALAALMVLGSATANAQATYVRGSNLIHLVGASYAAYRATGSVPPVFIGEEDRGGRSVRLCAYRRGGSGSGFGDNGHEVYVLAHVDVCPGTSIGPHWEAAGRSDCSGDDEGQTSGNAPSPARCNPGNLGKWAVCWDGSAGERNRYGEANGAPGYPWCTYKSVTACGSGSNPGRAFVCRP